MKRALVTALAAFVLVFFTARSARAQVVEMRSNVDNDTVEVGDGMSVLVGPDNGLLAPAVAMCGGAGRVVELTNADYRLPAPGPTFAGRDIFAPAAAHLCAGVPLDELGPLIEPTSLTPGLLPVSHVDDGVLVAEVLWVDGYGNAQLNLDPEEIAAFGDRVRLEFNGTVRAAKVVSTFGAVGPNEVGLIVDSYGLVAVVVDQGSAATSLGLNPATAVHLSSFDDEDGRESPVDLGVTTPVQLSPRRTGADA